MGQVALTLNGRTYRLRCEDGEEERLLLLGNHIRAHMDRLTREFGQVGDDRLLAMVAIMITDELFEARDRLTKSEQLAPAPAAVPSRRSRAERSEEPRAPTPQLPAEPLKVEAG